MKNKKTIIRLGVVLILLCAIAVGLRLGASIADNVLSDPEKMVHKYSDGKGMTFYGISVGVNNAYLLPCNRGWLMIDTGYPGDYDRFKKALRVTGISIGSIRWLFITHAHDEHAGYAARLREESGCRLIVPEKSMKDLKAGQMVWNGKSINRRIAVAAFLYGIVKRRDMSFPPVVIGPEDHILRSDDGTFLKNIGINGTIVSTPGHSPDSWSLLLSDGRTFCGDSAMNFLNVLGARYRPVFVSDEKQAYESLRKLLAGGAETFYTGHGPAFGRDKIEEILRR